MEGNSSLSNVRQRANSYLHSDNERSIILISPSASQAAASSRLTWSRSPYLDSIDLTEDNFAGEDINLDAYDDEIRKMLNKNYQIDLHLQKMDCPVCMESFLTLIKNGVKIMSTVCGHIFCEVCLFNSIKSNRKCPACREFLQLNTTLKQYSHRLFLPISVSSKT